jgi:hypothetical protein
LPLLGRSGRLDTSITDANGQLLNGGTTIVATMTRSAPHP